MPKIALQVKKGWEGARVRLLGKERRMIDLANATKSDLELLHARGHPAIEEKPPKAEKAGDPELND